MQRVFRGHQVVWPIIFHNTTPLQLLAKAVMQLLKALRYKLEEDAGLIPDDVTGIFH